MAAKLAERVGWAMVALLTLLVFGWMMPGAAGDARADVVDAAVVWNGYVADIRAADLVSDYFTHDALVLLLRYEIGQTPISCDWAWVDRPKFTADPDAYVRDPEVVEKVKFAWHNAGNVTLNWMPDVKNMPQRDASMADDGTSFVKGEFVRRTFPNRVAIAYVALSLLNITDINVLPHYNPLSGYTVNGTLSVDTYEAMLDRIRTFRTDRADKLYQAIARIFEVFTPAAPAPAPAVLRKMKV